MAGMASNYPRTKNRRIELRRLLARREKKLKVFKCCFFIVEVQKKSLRRLPGKWQPSPMVAYSTKNVNAQPYCKKENSWVQIEERRKTNEENSCIGESKWATGTLAHFTKHDHTQDIHFTMVYSRARSIIPVAPAQSTEIISLFQHRSITSKTINV